MLRKGCIDQWPIATPSRSLQSPVCRDRAVKKLSESKSNNNASRTQLDTEDASTLSVLNFASAAT